MEAESRFMGPPTRRDAGTSPSEVLAEVLDDLFVSDLDRTADACPLLLDEPSGRQRPNLFFRQGDLSRRGAPSRSALSLQGDAGIVELGFNLDALDANPALGPGPIPMLVPAKVTTASVLTSECISPCQRSHATRLKTDNPHNACARTKSLALPASTEPGRGTGTSP